MAHNMHSCWLKKTCQDIKCIHKEWKIQTTKMLLVKNIVFNVSLQGTTTSTTNHNLGEGMFAEWDSNLFWIILFLNTLWLIILFSPVLVHVRPVFLLDMSTLYLFYGTHICHLISDGVSRRGGEGLTYSSGGYQI